MHISLLGEIIAVTSSLQSVKCLLYVKYTLRLQTA